MRPIQEVFLESDFDSSRIARQKRDDRLAQLQAQGYECRSEDLHTVHTGMCLFLVSALPPTNAVASVDPSEPMLSQTAEPKPSRPKVSDKPSPKQGNRGRDRKKTMLKPRRV